MFMLICQVPTRSAGAEPAGGAAKATSYGDLSSILPDAVRILIESLKDEDYGGINFDSSPKNDELMKL